MWFYEYTLTGLRYRFSASTYEAALTELIRTRARSPQLTDIEIFAGGTEEFDSGTRLLSAREMRADPASAVAPASQNLASSLCADHGLELERLPNYGWLVRRADRGQERPVIGCIDEIVDGVELMEMDGGFRWMTFDSVVEAVTHLVRKAA